MLSCMPHKCTGTAHVFWKGTQDSAAETSGGQRLATLVPLATVELMWWVWCVLAGKYTFLILSYLPRISLGWWWGSFNAWKFLGFGDKAKMIQNVLENVLENASVLEVFPRLALLPHSSPQWQEEALGGCAGSDSFRPWSLFLYRYIW